MSLLIYFLFYSPVKNKTWLKNSQKPSPLTSSKPVKIHLKTHLKPTINQLKPAINYFK